MGQKWCKTVQKWCSFLHGVGFSTGAAPDRKTESQKLKVEMRTGYGKIGGQGCGRSSSPGNEGKRSVAGSWRRSYFTTLHRVTRRDAEVTRRDAEGTETSNIEPGTLNLQLRTGREAGAEGERESCRSKSDEMSRGGRVRKIFGIPRSGIVNKGRFRLPRGCRRTVAIAWQTAARKTSKPEGSRLHAFTICERVTVAQQGEKLRLISGQVKKCQRPALRLDAWQSVSGIPPPSAELIDGR